MKDLTTTEDRMMLAALTMMIVGVAMMLFAAVFMFVAVGIALLKGGAVGEADQGRAVVVEAALEDGASAGMDGGNVVVRVRGGEGGLKMDMRTDKVFAPDGHELTLDEISRLEQEPFKITGENCTDHCALAFKRNCFTVAKKFRDKCTRFHPQCLDYHKRSRQSMRDAERYTDRKLARLGNGKRVRA